MKMPKSFKTKHEEVIAGKKEKKIISPLDKCVRKDANYFDDWDAEECEPHPSKFYIIDAIGILFVKCSARGKAQEVVDEIYGKGKYTIRTTHTNFNSNKSFTARG